MGEVTTHVQKDKQDGRYIMRLETTGDAYRAMREHHRQCRRHANAGWEITRRGITADGVHYMEAWR